MTREPPDGSAPKRERHYDAMRRMGMKRVQIWVPDTTAPGFKEEAERQAKLINGTPEDIEVLALIEAVTEWPDE